MNTVRYASGFRCGIYYLCQHQYFLKRKHEKADEPRKPTVGNRQHTVHYSIEDGLYPPLDFA